MGLKFDYRDSRSGALIVMDYNTKDAILDSSELHNYINTDKFTLNTNGEVVLWVDWMNYEQFDKLANFLGIKY